MKTLCITGSVQSRLDPFAESLRKAGATAALPARLDQDLSIADWHRKVLALQKEHESPSSTWSPGHEWEQFAEKIFLANHSQPLWYWADTDSTQFLDFWFDFAPNTFFLLLHTSPHEVLMDAIEHGANTLAALQDTLEDWYKRTRQMLRFHLRHPSRSILLDSSSALGQVGAYMDALAQRWQLPLETTEIEQAWQNNHHRLAFYLVDKLLQNQPQALALHHEVQASLFLIDNGETTVSTPELSDIVSDYFETQHVLRAGQADNDILRQTLEATQSQLSHLEMDHRQLQVKGEQYRQELSETRSALENSNQENRLLLDQLGQIQKSLEKLTQEEQYKSQQLTQLSAEKSALLGQLDTLSKERTALIVTRDNLAREKTALATARDEQARLASERKAQVDTLTKEKAELAASRTALASARDEQARLANERKAQIDALTKEKADLVATRDALSKEKAALANERRAQIDALSKEKAELATARDEQARLASERKAQVDTLTKEKAELAASRTALASARDEQARLANERKAQIDALTKEKADLVATRDALSKEKAALANERRAQIDALSKEKAELATARDEQARLASERKAQVDTLTKEKAELAASRTALASARDEQAGLANERKAQIDTLAKEKADLIAAHDALAKEKAVLTATRDEQTRLANESKVQIDSLVKEKAGLAASRDALIKEKAELVAARDALAKEKAVLVAARDEQTRLAKDRKTQLDNLTKEKSELAAIRDRLTKEKNNLAAARDEQARLANKRQVQLEALSKEKAELIATRDALAKEKTTLATARDEQARLASERQMQLEALSREKSSLTTLYNEQIKLLNEHKVQIAALLKDKAELVAARYNLHKEKASLVVARDALLKERNPISEALQEQLKALSAEKAALQARLDGFTKEHEQQLDKLEESENENQQLLVQLHQTQEELERYLLRYQDGQTQLGEQQSRLRKMLKRYPDYWEFDTLEINPLESNENEQVVQWRLTELYIGGRLIPEIRFKTCLANGLAGIIIQRTKGTGSPAPLLRWPNVFATAEELPCIPSRGPSTQGNNAALSGLSTSDWDTLQHLAKQLAGLLAQPTDSRVPKHLNAAALSNGLLAFAKSLAGWPRMLRYDSIELQETLRNQGYERLGISLGNLRLGHHHWPALDYRLATVDTAPQPFGQNPRLEFPDGSARSVLQNWFMESNDDQGPRLELRFAQPNAMDTRVWNALSQNDQQLLGALIKTLPLQLEDLKQANPTASRPWQDWQDLAGMLRNTLRDILIRTTALRRTPAGIEE